MNSFKPDVIIAIGGGSPMDAAKGMWLFYELPEADIEGLKLKFMDIRKRTYKFPKLGEKAKMVAIPTTSGTGSEVTSFAVITDNIQLRLPPRFDADEKEAEELHATEMPMRNIFPKFVWVDTWERFKNTYPYFTLPEDKNVECVRIELKDLRELPRKYWYLGNNSFQLHGFFNYRYLVLGKLEEDKWFIGVPGIYQQQERMMAAIFGFPEFMTTDHINQFGYWYHTLDE